MMDKDEILALIKDEKLPLEEIAQRSGYPIDEIKKIKVAVDTIRICKEKNILKEYLTSREKEVIEILVNEIE